VHKSAELPPISVGASVDKMFAQRCRPLDSWLSGLWSKNDQIAYFNLQTARTPRNIAAFSGFPQRPRSCPQSLLALLWIRCLRSSAGQVWRGFRALDQKMINGFGKPWFRISHGFSLGFVEKVLRISPVVPICCGWRCG
jgi:hypothetical protein